MNGQTSQVQTTKGKWSDSFKWLADLISKIIVFCFILFVTSFYIEEYEANQSKALHLNSTRVDRMLDSWERFGEAVRIWRQTPTVLKPNSNEVDKRLTALRRDENYKSKVRTAVARLKISFQVIEPSTGKDANDVSLFADPLLQKLSHFHSQAKKWNEMLETENGHKVDPATRVDELEMDIWLELKDRVDAFGGNHMESWKEVD